MGKLVQVRVFDIVLAKTPYGLTSAVLLEEPGGKLVPILVDPYQASSIRSGLIGENIGGTHDLMLSLMRNLGIEFVQATIHDLVEDRFKANITVKLGENESTFDARASDAIALAVRANAPIYVNEELLNKVSVSREDLLEEGEE